MILHSCRKSGVETLPENVKKIFLKHNSILRNELTEMRPKKGKKVLERGLQRREKGAIYSLGAEKHGKEADGA